MRILEIGVAVCVPAIVAAQGTGAAVQPDTGVRRATAPAVGGPPVRRIASASSLSSEPLGAVGSVVELRDGRILVNDVVRRRLLLMDTSLSKVEIVLDSIAESSNTYGLRPGTLIPYRGDSVLFVDPASYAMLVLDPDAKITRVRSVWRVQDVFLFGSTTGNYGYPATDAQGRIVYRVSAVPAPPKVAPPAGVPWFPQQPDSAFVVAVNLDTRKLDTLGAIRTPKAPMQIRQTAEGFFSVNQVINPLPATDEWAVLSDGTVAFIRGVDYRIEYRAADGTLTSSPKQPYEWLRLTDSLKDKLLDSVKTANRRPRQTAFISSMIRWANMYNRPYPENFKIPSDYVPSPGFMKEWRLPTDLKLPANYIYGCPPGVEPTMIASAPAPAGASTASGASVAMPVAPAGMPVMPGGLPGGPGGTPSCIPSPVMISGGNAPPPPEYRDISVMERGELPDYRPPFGSGAVRADADGNLWVRTNPSKPTPGGPIFDVIDHSGAMIDRVQLPPGYAIVGFGKGRTVYLSMRDAKGIHVARVRLR